MSIGDTQNLEGGREDAHEQSKTLSRWFAAALQPSVEIGGKFSESPYLQWLLGELQSHSRESQWRFSDV